MDKETEKLNRIIDERIRKANVQDFTQRKLTDTPTDALAVVNRKFVTANGLSAVRPVSPVVGQFYFDTTVGFPIWWSGANWVNASGTPS